MANAHGSAQPHPAQQHPDTAPRSLCPVCGRLAVHRHLNTAGTVATATYLCERDHGWIQKWVKAG